MLKILNKIQTFLSIPNTSLLSPLEIYRLSKLKRYQPGVVKTRIGSIYYVDPVTLVSGNKEIFIDEVYKFSPKQKNPIVIDCGANIGLATIYFALVYDGLVFSYEADPNIFKCLMRNLETLSLNEKVKVTNSAIWTTNGEIEFDVEGGFSGQIKVHGHSQVKQTIKVPSLTLRSILSKFDIIDMLKIDIEGAEYDVLLDNYDALENVNCLFIEYHSHISEEQKLDQILGNLSKIGFRYSVKEAFASPHPFVESVDMLGMDLQLNIYAYRNN